MIFEPSQVATEDMARLVYLLARAMSTALHFRGAEDPRLYDSTPTPLALWAGLTRGNLVALLTVQMALLKESDRRRGTQTTRGDVRFTSARRCLAAATACAGYVPWGPVRGTPPLAL